MNPVRQCGLILLAAMSAACGAARAKPMTPGAGRPFSATSFGQTPGIQVRLEGSAEVRDRWVYVTASTGAVRTYQLDRQDYWDLRVRAAVAACKGRNFEIVSEGRAVRLAPLLGLARDSARLDATPRSLRDTLRLDVGIPPNTVLEKSWLALIFEWPFENLMASYDMHTNTPIDVSYGPWTGRTANEPFDRCR